EAILLGFQHYLVMLGTTVLIPSSLVPQMGGENVRFMNSILFKFSILCSSIHNKSNKHSKFLFILFF
ncbi:hypothetical protein S83_062889, partial [Arachis hypogaea]